MTTLEWMQPIMGLKGVGPKLYEKFEQMGLETFKDLLLHIPLRYEDRTRLYPLNHLILGQYALIEAEVVDTQIKQARKRQLTLTLSEGHTQFKVLFYHYYPNQEKAYAIGRRVRCYGQVARIGMYLGMVHPEVEILYTSTPLSGFLTAVYPAVKGLSQKLIRKCISDVFGGLGKRALTEEVLPKTLLEKKSWPSFLEALHFIHQPPPSVTLERLEAGQLPAMTRLICEELLAHQLSWRQYRAQILKQPTRPIKISNEILERFIGQLPFQLTQAQIRVVAEIRQDCTKCEAMMRLLQGDVGSGKTIVAAISALLALHSGKKVALMAPTGLLANQHAVNFSNWFESWGFDVLKLTGLTTAKERKHIHEKLMGPDPVILIGTHALIQDDVQISNLGLVIIDEQHRFGVQQRLKLCDKNSSHPPHQLIMTATPIPRTLVMTYYADMAVSILDELPKGRQPIVTVVLPGQKRSEVIRRIKSVCESGQQVYWVCPLIEISEELDATAATEALALLKAELSGLNVGMVHGQLPSLEKEAVMLSFRTGHLQVLVATTVIEVGVDVPNATLMVIENAERLGLAQVHQLRGRVGRGANQSYCVLLFEGPLSEVARERLEVLRSSTDGFEISEKDLTLRGPGEVLGTKQSGARQFKLADLSRDGHHMKEMAALAPTFWAQHPEESQVLISRWCEDRIPFGKV